MNFKTTLIASAISSFVISSSYAAQNSEQNTEQSIERVTVTSDFRQQQLQQSSSTVSIVTETQIADRNAQNLEEIVALTPNVNFASGSSRARYYQVRGIGERSQFSEPINPSVGIVIDDVDFSGIGSVASLFDVAQVEVFRGPQGTRFGANAMAGLINITTNPVTEEFEGKARFLLGNYNTQGLGAVVSGPLVDNVNYRLSVEQFQNDGFIENTHLNRDDTNNRDEFKLHGKLQITSIENLVIDLSAVYIDMDNGYDAFSLDNTRKTLSDKPGFDSQKTQVLSSKFTYSKYDIGTLIGLFSYADSDIGYGYDEDWAYAGIHDWEYASVDHYFRDRESFSSELRLVSNESHKIFDQTTQWVVGVYNRSEKETLRREYTYLDSDYESDFDTNNFAVFAQLDSQLSDKWLLTSGLRVEQRSADFIDTGTAFFNPQDTMVGGKLVLSYAQDDTSMYYGSINKGFKAGGFNTDGSLAPQYREFGAETLINYELGKKFSLFDEKAFIRAAVFYSDRRDMQVKSSYTVLRDDGSTEFIGALLNAAEGVNKGVEVEATWYVNEKLIINSSLGFLRTKYVDYVNAKGLVLSGREQAHAPKYQYNISANYVVDNNWLVNISVEGKDSFYVSDSPISWTVDDATYYAAKTDSYLIANASVNYQNNNWLVKLWARNITDKDYQVRGFDSFGNDPRKYYETEPYFQYGEPAVFGLTAEYSF